MAVAPAPHPPRPSPSVVGPVQHAPPPVVDRYPILLGSNITLQYVSNALRVCSTGYRQTFVDLFDELLERESHSQAMCLRCACRPSPVGACPSPRHRCPQTTLTPTSPARSPTACALTCWLWMTSRPHRQPRLGRHPRGVRHRGAMGQSDGFWPTRLQFVHSRRLSYPDPMTWDLHLWDQGTVTGWGSTPVAGAARWGINITRDMPAGKFRSTPRRCATPTRPARV